MYFLDEEAHRAALPGPRQCKLDGRAEVVQTVQYWRQRHAFCSASAVEHACQCGLSDAWRPPQEHGSNIALPQRAFERLIQAQQTRLLDDARWNLGPELVGERRGKHYASSGRYVIRAAGSRRRPLGQRRSCRPINRTTKRRQHARSRQTRRFAPGVCAPLTGPLHPFDRAPWSAAC